MKPSPESSGVEVFDPRGDLRLIVGADQVVFQVCSRALARSSLVWETLLYGPFSEGKAQQKGDDWEIPLPEERPEELRIIFSVVHGNFDNLPQAIARSELFSLTVLADKYDMIRSLKPFWLGWVTSAEPNNNCGTADDLLDYLSICHRLGYGHGFCKAFSCFVTRAATYDDGQLYIDGFQDYDLYRDDRLQLLDILKAVKTGRQAQVNILCTRVKAAMESLIYGSRCTSQDEACDFAMLGALYRVMASHNLDHWFSTRMEGVEDSITHCLPKFSSLLSDIRSETVATFVLLISSWSHAKPCCVVAGIAHPTHPSPDDLPDAIPFAFLDRPPPL